MRVTRREFLLQTAPGLRRLRARRGRVRGRGRAVRPDQPAGPGIRTTARWSASSWPAATTATTWSCRRRPPSTTLTRPHGATSGLAIPRDSLLPITPLSIGNPFGLHPSLAELPGALDRAEGVGGLQRRAAGAAADAAGLSERRAASVPAVLALRPGGAVADVDRRSGQRDRVGRTHGRSVRAAAVGVPDDHGAVGRHLHARSVDLAAVDRARADRARTRCWC